MRLAAEGDTRAFRRLYDDSVDQVARTARWLMSSAEVEDVVQDVFIRAWARLPSLHDPASFESWLHRLSVNVILRSRERRGRIRGREESLEEVHGRAAPMAPAGLRLDLDRAVGVLPPRARDVFVLYDVQGFSHKEIASMLGVSHHTSRSQLHRARALMREYLNPAEGGRDE